MVAKHRHFSRYRTYTRKHRLGGPDIYMCVYPTDIVQYDDSKVLYQLNELSKGEIYGQSGLDETTIEREGDNQHHWDYAIKKCRSQ